MFDRKRPTLGSSTPERVFRVVVALFQTSRFNTHTVSSEVSHIILLGTTLSDIGSKFFYQRGFRPEYGSLEGPSIFPQ